MAGLPGSENIVLGTAFLQLFLRDHQFAGMTRRLREGRWPKKIEWNGLRNRCHISKPPPYICHNIHYAKSVMGTGNSCRLRIALFPFLKTVPIPDHRFSGF